VEKSDGQIAGEQPIRARVPNIRLIGRYIVALLTFIVALSGKVGKVEIGSVSTSIFEVALVCGGGVLIGIYLLACHQGLPEVHLHQISRNSSSAYPDVTAFR